MTWDEFEKQCSACKKCGLADKRKSVVIGRGNINAPIMFVGEGPGEQEDLKGLPFVGPAGKLLDLLLEALEFNEESYYIANIVKCRPPANRVPFDEEANQCLSHLRNQLILVKPQIMVCLGSTAIKYIIDKDAKITQIRGVWTRKKGYWIMPTFHPAALLRDSSKKVEMWEDMKKVMEKYRTIQ